MADLRDLEWMGSETAVFRMRRSKTGDDGPKPVTGEAAIALRDWLAAAKITEGALFRRLWGPKVGPRLSPHAIAAIVKKRARSHPIKDEVHRPRLAYWGVTQCHSPARPNAIGTYRHLPDQRSATKLTISANSVELRFPKS